jgi:O-antigen/teichoic acid export membrane protein
MSLRAAIFKGGSHLALGQILNSACSFVRNLIIARVISPSDFGIAATFAMTLSLMTMISNISTELLLVQSPDGDCPRLQGTAHLSRVGRGILNASVLLLIAAPMSRLFGVPQAKWAFECLAIYPLVAGFTHFDMFRVQREMKFLPSVWVTVGSNALATIVAIPLAFWLRDYSVMLWVLLLQSISSTIASHVVADRRYTWSWDKQYAKMIFTFGWPLLINGLLMYGIFEGDRLVIGSADRIFTRSHFTLTDLGVYSVAFGLAMAPTMMASNVSNPLFLPILSRAQRDRVKFDEAYLFTSQIISLAAIGITIPLILTGGWAVKLLYGAKYAGAASFIGLLAAMWGIRMLRAAPTIAAISKGDTRNAMYSNVARSLALVGMLVVAAVGGGLAWIAACGVAGEILALAVTIWRLQLRHQVQAAICLRPFAPSAVGMAVACLLAVEGMSTAGPLLTIPTCAVIVSAAVAITVRLFPNLRHDFRSLMSNPSKVMAPEKAPVVY